MADTNLIYTTPPNGVIVGNSNGTSNNKLTLIKKREPTDPPDGGARAIVVMISAFFCNSILFGIINTYGTVYLTLHQNLQLDGDVEASSKAALVGSLTIGTTFFLSPVSGILTDKIGLRLTTFIGGLLVTGGMLLSAIFSGHINVLYLTYGVMFGFGAALAYTPTLAILGHYFKDYLGIVSGFVTSGSSIFTALLPTMLKYLLDTRGFKFTCCMLATFSSIVILCALVYKPRHPPPPPMKRKPGQSSADLVLRSLVNVDNWKKKRYIIWALSIPVALIGYFVPYVHMAKYVQDAYPNNNENSPIICIGITSGLGRLVFGYIADYKGVNRIGLQQFAFVMIGLCTMAIPFAGSYGMLIIISLAMGIVDGCFISLLGPIAFDICGAQGATQAIGFLLGLCSIPLTVGPPIAGLLYDHTKSYTLSFVLAGIPALIGAAIMCLIQFVEDEPSSSVVDPEQVHVPLARPAWLDENLIEVKLPNGNSADYHSVPHPTAYTGAHKTDTTNSDAVNETADQH